MPSLPPENGTTKRVTNLGETTDTGVNDMIWRGRYNAILFVVFLGSAVLSYITQTPYIAIWVFSLIIIIRIVVWMLNMGKTAVTGKPLVYDTKITSDKPET